MPRTSGKEIGVTGLTEWSGRIAEDFLKELRGKAGYKRYNEMRLNSPVIGSMLFAIEQSIRTVSWNYVSELGEEDPRVGFLEDALKGMTSSWNDHISEVLTMLPFGFAPFEIIYERVDGKIVWRKFGFRGQDTVVRWLFDDNGGMEGFEQRSQPDYRLVTIPIEKLILYRTRVEKNNPEGRSLLRTAWVPYYYAKNIMQIEAIGIERDLAGLPVITLPEGASTDESDSNSDYSKADKLVRNVRNDQQAGIVLPSPEWTFELASTEGTRNFNTDDVIRRYESRMLMSALAQFLILGQNSVGTQALASDMTDFWGMSVNATADIISESHTKFAMKKLLILNGMDHTGIKMEHSPAGDVDVGDMAVFLQQVGNKITWLPSDEQWLRGLANLPEADMALIEAERAKQDEERNAFMQFKADRTGATEYFDNLVEEDLPVNPKRKKAERGLEKLMNAFLGDQKERIIKEVTK